MSDIGYCTPEMKSACCGNGKCVEGSTTDYVCACNAGFGGVMCEINQEKLDKLSGINN